MRGKVGSSSVRHCLCHGRPRDLLRRGGTWPVLCLRTPRGRARPIASSWLCHVRRPLRRSTSTCTREDFRGPLQRDGEAALCRLGLRPHCCARWHAARPGLLVFGRGGLGGAHVCAAWRPAVRDPSGVARRPPARGQSGAAWSPAA